MSELRKDPVSGRWVIIARERAERPNPYRASTAWKATGEPCPFCPGNEAMTPREILSVKLADAKAGGKPWNIRVVPNRHPALHIEGALDTRPEGLYDKMQGVGAHEVVIECSDHKDDPSMFSSEQMANVIRVYRDRIADLIQDVRFRYVLIFKNQGELAGATLEHSHSQVIALPVVPNQIERELLGARNHFKYRGRCIYCDMLNQEIHDGKRLVVQNGDFVAYAPFASRFPFEVHILPRDHNAFFWKLSDPQLARLGEILRDVLRRYKMALKNPPYNYVIHTAPPGYASPEQYHWQLQVMPRLTEVAGFEWGTGFYINPMPPEDAAQHLRDLDRFMDIPEGELMTPAETKGSGT